MADISDVTKTIQAIWKDRPTRPTMEILREVAYAEQQRVMTMLDNPSASAWLANFTNDQLDAVRGDVERWNEHAAYWEEIEADADGTLGTGDEFVRNWGDFWIYGKEFAGDAVPFITYPWIYANMLNALEQDATARIREPFDYVDIPDVPPIVGDIPWAMLGLGALALFVLGRLSR